MVTRRSAGSSPSRCHTVRACIGGMAVFHTPDSSDGVSRRINVDRGPQRCPCVSGRSGTAWFRRDHAALFGLSEKAAPDGGTWSGTIHPPLARTRHPGHAPDPQLAFLITNLRMVWLKRLAPTRSAFAYENAGFRTVNASREAGYWLGRTCDEVVMNAARRLLNPS